MSINNALVQFKHAGHVYQYNPITGVVVRLASGTRQRIAIIETGLTNAQQVQDALYSLNAL